MHDDRASCSGLQNHWYGMVTVVCTQIIKLEEFKTVINVIINHNIRMPQFIFSTQAEAAAANLFRDSESIM